MGNDNKLSDIEFQSLQRNAARLRLIITTKQLRPSTCSPAISSLSARAAPMFHRLALHYFAIGRHEQGRHLLLGEASLLTDSGALMRAVHVYHQARSTCGLDALRAWLNKEIQRLIRMHWNIDACS